jgi:hypothetical protein
MSLQARIETMALRVQEELDRLDACIGNLALLATSNKASLVEAINDVADQGVGGAAISRDPGNAITHGSDGGLYSAAVIVSTLHW